MSAQASQVTATPYPVRTQSATAKVQGVETDASCMYFADKIMITISQSGRLAHWIHIPLDVAIPEAPPITSESDYDLPPSDLLPMSQLTATTILGGRSDRRDTYGQLLATQIASMLKSRNPDETRLIVLGLGLSNPSLGRDSFMDLVELALGIV